MFYRLVAVALRVYFRFFHGVTVIGSEKVPMDNAPLILACNHASNIDPPLVGAFFPRRLRFLAKDSLFKNYFFSKVITHLGAVPVSREDSQRAGAVIKKLLNLLTSGANVLVFPEGTRSSTGKLQAIEGGVALMAQKSKATVLPVYIGGSFDACPKGSLPKPLPLYIFWGDPIDSEGFLNTYGDKMGRLKIQSVLEESLIKMQDHYLDIRS